MPAALHGPAGPSTPRARGNCHHTKRRTRGAGGAPGMVRDGACPNLLQRRSGLGSTTEERAEYQRFFSCISARPGPLQQIWTTRAAAGPGRGAASRTTTTAASRSAGRAHENVHQGLVLAGRGTRRTPAHRCAREAGSSSRVAVSGPGRLLASGVYFALEKAVPTAALESGADISARKGPTASDEGRFRRPTPFRSPIVPHGGAVSRMS